MLQKREEDQSKRKILNTFPSCLSKEKEPKKVRMSRNLRKKLLRKVRIPKNNQKKSKKLKEKVSSVQALL